MTDINTKKAGLPKGFKFQKTVRKQAVKRLEAIVLDDNAPTLAQAMASTALLAEVEK